MLRKNTVSLCLVSCLILGVYTETFKETKNYTLCAYFRGAVSHISEDGAIAEDFPTDSIVKCKYTNNIPNYCYAVWQDDPNNGTILLDQGKSIEEIFSHTIFIIYYTVYAKSQHSDFFYS